MTATLEDTLKNIQYKVTLLSRQLTSLQKENIQLKAALGAAKEQAATLEAASLQYRQQLDGARYQQGNMAEEERKIFEKKINAYIRQIDKCIALLSD